MFDINVPTQTLLYQQLKLLKKTVKVMKLSEIYLFLPI